MLSGKDFVSCTVGCFFFVIANTEIMGFYFILEYFIGLVIFIIIF